MSKVRRVELRSPAEVEELWERLEMGFDGPLDVAVEEFWRRVGLLYESHDRLVGLIRSMNAEGRLSEYRAERVTGWARSTVRGVLGKPKKGVV